MKNLLKLVTSVLAFSFLFSSASFGAVEKNTKELKKGKNPEVKIVKVPKYKLKYVNKALKKRIVLPKYKLKRAK